MNIEELKLVLSAVETVTGDAKTVAIWYFAANYGVSLLKVLIVVVGLVLLVRGIAKAFINASEWATLGRTVSKAWGGPGEEYVYTRDRTAMQGAIQSAPQRGNT
jgi:hypothetical protein